MIQILEGNLLDAKEDIIGHQVNTLGAMGAGLAKQIKEKYPYVYQAYRAACQSEDKHSLMGKVLPVATSDGKTIANLFGQMGVGRGVRQTDYNALHLALTKLKSYAITNEKTVALPYGIGCGLAGGDWNVVYKMIEEAFDGYEVILYKFR